MERLGENATAFVHFIENGKGKVVQISQKKKSKRRHPRRLEGNFLPSFTDCKIISMKLNGSDLLRFARPEMTKCVDCCLLTCHL